MSDERASVAWKRVRSWQARADRRWEDLGVLATLERLTPADWLSLAALLVAWVSALLLVSGEPNWGVVAMLGAFGFDKLDGYYARRHGISSPFGRQVDSFIDVFAYLVTGALLYHVALSPHVVASVVVGFLVIGFGGLRLVRHNQEGFHDDDGTSYYRGMTVVHVAVAVLANYLLAAFVPAWNGWLAAATVAPLCPLMVSNYRSYKTVRRHYLAGIVCLAVAALALAIEYGIAGTAP